MDNSLRTNNMDKINKYFEGRVVRKDLANIVKGNLPVPTFVVEYLLAQYCATDDEEQINEGVEKVKQIISKNYVHRADATRIKGQIHDESSRMIIDKVSVQLNDGKENRYEASLANLDLKNIPLNDDTVTSNPKLLSGNGVWCIVRVCYDNETEGTKERWGISSLKPIQISGIDIQEFINLRKEFTTDEWIDLLVKSVGIDPTDMNKRAKLIQLSRLLPLIENNFNYMELGPKGTGKSHIFQEFSPHGVLVSGGDITSARLFVKYSGNKEIMGLIGYWDVVAWDEFEHQPGKHVDPVMIDTMQNYLANKSFNRGKASHEASASMSFIGNTKHTVPYMLNNSHLFESIPTAFQKGAFLDRIHMYVPGWEVPILKKTSFNSSFGLITDYLAEILHGLRREDFTNLMTDKVTFHSSLSERDSNAIRKSFSALAKLIFPDRKMTDEEVLELIDFATEGRKRIKDQLYKIDETFKADPAKFIYTIKSTGEEVAVETLELLNNNIDFDDNLNGNTLVNEVEPGNIHVSEQQTYRVQGQGTNQTQGAQSNDGTENTATQSKDAASGQVLQSQGSAAGQASPSTGGTTDAASKKSMSMLDYSLEPNVKNVSIRDNQKGVSYKSLFAAHLYGAKKIRLEDPYIRMFYQMRNLVELITLLVRLKKADEQIEFHLVTWNDSEHMGEAKDRFIEIQQSAANVGIDFTYEFKKFHDRKIVTDTGWEILLSRGISFYEAHNSLSVEDMVQESRSCKSFNVTYCKTKQGK